MDIEDQKPVHICCSDTPFFFVKYVMLVVICLLILSFSIVQIVLHPNDSNVVYYTLISTILGLFIPHPSARLDVPPATQAVAKS